MKAEYDFSKAKRAKNVSHLAKLQAENATGKTRITMYLDNAVVQAFREQAEAEGKGFRRLSTMRYALSFRRAVSR